jgi:hypothetical protein
MPVQIQIRDKSDSIAEIDAPAGEKQALTVSTRELKTYNSKVVFFENETNGANMNVNAALGGVPVNIHDGIDNPYWTASAISGAWTFNSAAQNHTPAGANSIDATATNNNDTAQITAGAPQALSGYVSLSGWIYITGWSTSGTKGVEIFGWDTGAPAIEGVAVDIGDYINTAAFNTWQQFVIPLGDMGLTGLTIDAIRIVTIDVGAGPPPNYYLDDIQIEQTGTALEYFIRPDDGTWLHVETVQFTIADAYTGIVTVAGATENATMPGIPYDALLGVAALTVGITYQFIQDGNVSNIAVVNQLSDLLQLPDTELINSISDGTNTLVTIKQDLSYPITLKSEDNDRMRILINDNLSGLLLFRIATRCREEIR